MAVFGSRRLLPLNRGRRDRGLPRRADGLTYIRRSLLRRPMALEAIAQALWFFLPAFVANPMAVVFGGGTPIDFGRTLSDGERIFGDGKTWRGLLGGTSSGALLGLVLAVPLNALAPESRWSFGPYADAFVASALLA